MPTVFANSRSITHKGDGFVDTCAVPDVCKTPSPGGPVPIPYVNVAMDSDLAKGTKKVKIEGNPVALDSSNLKMSTGDEPGSAGGGIISSKTKGKATWAMGSMDVKFEGKAVIRFSDVAQHNGNTFNSAFIQLGGTGFAYGDDPQDDENCSECEKPKDDHKVLETPDVESEAKALIEKLNEIDANYEPPNKAAPSSIVLRKKGAGFMVGVLICNCKKRFAAMSGPEATEGFKQAVDELGFTLCGKPSVKEFVNGKGEKVVDAEKKFPALKGQNAPDQCAAPKLIQKAQSTGHTPVAMSEKLYAPRNKPKKVTVTYKKTVGVREDAVTTDKPEDFVHGATVPSCVTCQVNLTKVLCKDKPLC